MSTTMLLEIGWLFVLHNGVCSFPEYKTVFLCVYIYEMISYVVDIQKTTLFQNAFNILQWAISPKSTSTFAISSV